MLYPSYLNLYKTGELIKRVESAKKLLESCVICPRKCRINRLKDEKGVCKTGRNAIVTSYFLHHGEEPPISGTSGSGTIFFTHCNLKCVYCQNYKLSQEGEGREVKKEELAEFMLELQHQGAHNINLVTPTHVMPQILEALRVAIEKGLKIPLVYNTGGYELVPILRLLDGIIDIYLPDMRYADALIAEKYSNAYDYPSFNQKAVKEMYRQAGNAAINPNGVIEKGIIIRHLVLPNNIAGTEKILYFIKNELSGQCHISLMSQYFPCYKTCEFPLINRRISCEEYEIATGIMKKLGLTSGWVQESQGLARFAGLNIKPNV
ncbi:MAG: radical SAM protein [Candidatus Omnitrophota bacterium]|nr:radical SAM protein [Candidatus Omnitrophota bacterium]